MSGLGIKQCCGGVNGLGPELRVSVNPIMKFIYTLCKCMKLILIHFNSCKWVQMENTKCVSVKLCKFILCHVKECNSKCKNKFIYIGLQNPIKKCKCKNIYIYMILHGSIKQCDHTTI